MMAAKYLSAEKWFELTIKFYLLTLYKNNRFQYFIRY